MSDLVKNVVVKTDAGVEISNFTGDFVSEEFYLPGITGFSIQASGTSMAQIDTELSLDGVNWTPVRSVAPPALSYMHEVVQTNACYVRVVGTTAVGITLRIVVVK